MTSQVKRHSINDKAKRIQVRCKQHGFKREQNCAECYICMWNGLFPIRGECEYY